MSPLPMIPGILHMNAHAHLWEAFLMPKPTNAVKNMLTRPEGVLRSADCLGVNPMFLINVEEYVTTTPLETDCYGDC